MWTSGFESSELNWNHNVFICKRRQTVLSGSDFMQQSNRFYITAGSQLDLMLLVQLWTEF